jgi:general stress protein 26
MDALKKQIFEVIGQPHLACFATVTEEGKPWARYVMATGDEDLTVRFATFVDSRKVGQIHLQPEVHLTCGATDPTTVKTYLQIQGKARLVTDEQERKALWNQELQRYFSGSDDPKFGVVIVEPYRIEVNTMGQIGPQIWET